MKRFILSIVCAGICITSIYIDHKSRRNDRNDYWSDEANWYTGGNLPDNDKADLLYFTSTDIAFVADSSGNKLDIALMTEEDRKEVEREFESARKMFGDSLNFIAPYYHQFTANALYYPKEKMDSIIDVVSEESMDAFRYYMKHLNGGRRYILAGFSQGAMIALHLLKNMSEDEYSRLIATYMIGYRLTEDDLANPHVIPAKSPYEEKAVISFNSVTTPEAAWPLVSEGAATCINPLNWSCDTIPSRLVFRGDTLTVKIDAGSNLLTVTGADADKYEFAPLSGFVKKGNLHHWDFFFYRNAIRKNALERAYPKMRRK